MVPWACADDASHGAIASWYPAICPGSSAGARVLIARVVLAPLVPRRGAPVAPPITVSAAVSLTDALTAAAGEYGGGAAVRFNFAASNVLARQIVSGAPVDVFVSADEAQMDVVAAAGWSRRHARRLCSRNQLAIVVPDDRPRTLSGIRELLDPAFTRIAIGDPAAVPAGVYAKAVLGEGRSVEPLSSRGSSGRQRPRGAGRGRNGRGRRGDRLSHRRPRRAEGDGRLRGPGRPRPAHRLSAPRSSQHVRAPDGEAFPRLPARRTAAARGSSTRFGFHRRRTGCISAAG